MTKERAAWVSYLLRFISHIYWGGTSFENNATTYYKRLLARTEKGWEQHRTLTFCLDPIISLMLSLQPHKGPYMYKRGQYLYLCKQLIILILHSKGQWFILTDIDSYSRNAFLKFLPVVHKQVSFVKCLINVQYTFILPWMCHCRATILL